MSSTRDSLLKTLRHWLEDPSPYDTDDIYPWIEEAVREIEMLRKRVNSLESEKRWKLGQFQR